MANPPVYELKLMSYEQEISENHDYHVPIFIPLLVYYKYLMPDPVRIHLRPLKTPDMISILIADDHKLIRETWTYILNRDSRFKVIGSCSNSEEAVKMS